MDKFAHSGFFLPKMVEGEKINLAYRIPVLAEDVPYNVLKLSHTVWTRLWQSKAEAKRKTYLTADLIDETHEILVRQNDPVYVHIWNGLTGIQKRALMAVVSENGQQLQSMRVVTTTGISPSSMRKSLESMTEQNIIRQEMSEGSSVQFPFEDPFFRSWIRFFIS